MIKNTLELLSEDIVCAIVENGQLTITDAKHAPLFLDDFRSWAEHRAISENRGYVARLLKTSSDISPNASAYETSLKANCACITDNYWVREVGSGLIYADVNYDAYDGRMVRLALGLDTDLRNYHPSGRNPELTNIGDSNKAWSIDNAGIRWLCKRQMLHECYNEIIASRIAKKLGINTVEYELVAKTDPDPYKGQWGIVRSRDFTQNKGVNLEHAELLLRHYGVKESDICENARIFHAYGCEKEYLDIIYLDIITGNGDRHSRNYGVLRCQKTGDIIGFAPNFDNNYAFTRDLDMTNFVEAAYTWRYNPPVLSEDDLKDVRGEIETYLDYNAKKQIQEVSWKQKSLVDMLETP